MRSWYVEKLSVGVVTCSRIEPVRAIYSKKLRSASIQAGRKTGSGQATRQADNIGKQQGAGTVASSRQARRHAGRQTAGRQAGGQAQAGRQA